MWKNKKILKFKYLVINFLWLKLNLHEIMHNKYEKIVISYFSKIFVTYGTLLWNFHILESSVELWFETTGYYKNGSDSRSYDSLKGTITYFIQILGFRLIWLL